MTEPEPLSSTEARRIATSLLARLGNVRTDSPEYGNVATAALAYATLAPQLGPSQTELEWTANLERGTLGYRPARERVEAARIKRHGAGWRPTMPDAVQW